MKRLIVLLLILLIPGLAFAGLPYVLGIAGTSAAGDDYSDIVFFWRCETTTLTTGDYSAGDTTAAASSAIELTEAASMVGVYGISNPTSADYYIFDVASNDTVPATGRIGMWIKFPELPVDGAMLFNAYIDDDDRFNLTMTSTGDLNFYWRDEGSSRTTCASTTDPISSDTAHFIEIAWDTDYREIFVDGVSVAECTTTKSNHSALSSSLRIGNNTNITPSAAYYIDNVMISNDKTRNLYLLRNETASPR